MVERIAEIMRLEIQQGFPNHPVVLCGADFDARLKRLTYCGEQTCPNM